MPLLTLVSASALVLVGAYCASRVVVPSWRDPAHPVELDGLHVVMSAAMVAMLLDVVPRVWALALSALLVASVVRCFTGALRRRSRAAYARDGVVGTVMVVMLLPASAQAGTLHGMQHAQGVVASPDLTTALYAGGIAAVVAVGGWAAHQLVLGREGAACRIGAACELTMAAAMGSMLVAML